MKSFTVFASTIMLAMAAHAAPVTNAANDDKLLTQMEVNPLIYLSAFAAAPAPMPQACIDANFTADQQIKMKDAIYQSERKMVSLKADLKLAMMDYGHVIMDTTTAITDAQTSATALSTAVGALANNKLDLMNTLLYTVLTTDQRASAIDCFMAIEKAAMEKKLGEVCAKLPKQP